MTKAANGEQTRYSLTIQNTVSQISGMSDWLTRSLTENGVSDSLQFRLDLCANEAVTNIVSYGYQDKGTHEIKLSLELNNERVMLVIEDDGVAFNPFSKAEHQQPKSLYEAEIGGLGIDLIRHYSDEFNYARRDNTNVLSLTYKLTSE